MYRTGKLAVLYYPEVHADDPDYTLAGDVEWVLAEAPDLDSVQRAELQELIGRVILDPTGNREALAHAIYAAARV
ncbi:hypothetical protein GCM10022382_28150 [Microbacterium invictum]